MSRWRAKKGYKTKAFGLFIYSFVRLAFFVCEYVRFGERVGTYWEDGAGRAKEACAELDLSTGLNLKRIPASNLLYNGENDRQDGRVIITRPRPPRYQLPCSLIEF